MLKKPKRSTTITQGYFWGRGKNTVHRSDSEASVKRECALVFNKIRHEPSLINCSCLVYKPHTIKDGNAGKIIDIILFEGFEIYSMLMFNIDKIQAEEFFQVFKVFYLNIVK